MIERLLLANFRSYESLALATGGAKTVIITGENGAGKTNVLESISMLSPAGPFRKASMGELVRIGAQPPAWSVFARIGGEDFGVSFSSSRGGEEACRKAAANGEPSDMASIQQRVKIVWATPSTDRLFTEAGGERRRFLDALISNFHPFYAAQTAQYGLLLKQRAKVLKSPRFDAQWCSAIEGEAARLGVSIAAARLEFEEKLNAVSSSEAYGFPRVKASVSGLVEDMLRHGKAAPSERAFAGELAANREAFKTQSAPSVPGVHRSDFSAFNSDRGIDAAQTSTGEQKMAVISIVIAYARMLALYFGQWPILIIDEAPAHLDADRREQLFFAIDSLPTQAWLSGTCAADFDFFRGRDAKFFHIEDSKII
ncbi:MAG: hypothetical protein LBH41_01010 [Rickettsiales bacterium]|jgi:DNA replication and repair protein RecF|nr:hypothetical protein [Rickettsiales bacterium]